MYAYMTYMINNYIRVSRSACEAQDLLMAPGAVILDQEYMYKI